MTQRKVYIDFGSGFVDISESVKYNTLSITRRAYNDTYHYAQNSLSLDIIWSNALFSSIIAATSHTSIYVVDYEENGCILTESGLHITTEDDLCLYTEQGLIEPVFYGHLEDNKSWTYNGIPDNTIVTLSAVDNLDTLDIAVGDIVCANFSILDPTSPSTSLVHYLTALAGWSTANITSAISIPVVLDRFAPPDEDDTILELLDTLLYEYGYTLNINSANIITPMKWAYATGSTPIFTFDDTNIINEVKINQSVHSYDSIEVTYYELKSADDVLLYRDDNCGYNDDGTFAGYNILAGRTYPPDTNVIDETTGVFQIVEQEYTEDGISYLTNKAVVNNLDYNISAFSSDFSAIVCTEGQYLHNKYSTGITLPITPIFGSKKCRIMYENTTADNTLKLYYNNVYGTMWYKTSERTSVIDLITAYTNRHELSTTFLYEKQYADALASTLANQYANKKYVYTFSSEEAVMEGSLVQIALSDGVTNQLCLILSVEWDEAEELYYYTLMSTGTTTNALTSQTVTTVATVDTNYTYAAITGTITATTIVDLTAKYAGIGVPTASSSSVVRYSVGYTSPNYLFVEEDTINVNVGDWVFVRHYSGDTADSVKAIAIWDGTTWATTGVTNYHRTTAAQDLMDVCKVYGTPTTGDSYEWFNSLVANQAFIDFLMVRTLTLQEGGLIQSENYIAGTSGLRITAEGEGEFNNLVARGDITTDTLRLGVNGMIDGASYAAPAFIGDATNIASFGIPTGAVSLGRGVVVIWASLRYITMAWVGFSFKQIGPVVQYFLTIGSYGTTTVGGFAYYFPNLGLTKAALRITESSIAIHMIYTDGSVGTPGIGVVAMERDTSDVLRWKLVSFNAHSIADAASYDLTKVNNQNYLITLKQVSLGSSWYKHQVKSEVLNSDGSTTLLHDYADIVNASQTQSTTPRIRFLSTTRFITSFIPEQYDGGDTTHPDPVWIGLHSYDPATGVVSRISSIHPPAYECLLQYADTYMLRDFSILNGGRIAATYAIYVGTGFTSTEALLCIYTAVDDVLTLESSYPVYNSTWYTSPTAVTATDASSLCVSAQSADGTLSVYMLRTGFSLGKPMSDLFL